jgi:hypothetical protein
MAALTTQNVVDAGTAPTFDAAAATSNTAEVGNGKNTFYVVKNSNAATRTVTITVAGNTDYGQPTPDPVITVAALTGEVWIPLRKAYDAADGTGRATIVLEATAGVTHAVVRVS